jgi:hypothetical protein
MQRNKEDTHSSDIGMINPRLYDQRSYTIHDNNCIIVLGCHSEYESIASMPCCKIFAGKKQDDKQQALIRYPDDSPITFISINSDIIFSTIRAYKH